MFSLILENANGDQLTFGAGSPYTISEINGLNPPSATINTSQIALIDGAKYNSAKLDMRQLNIAFAIETDAAANRVAMYNVLKSKQWIRMYYSGDVRDVYIDGYIQSIDITYFAMKQIVTVAILCPSPYFKNAQEIVNQLSNIINTFYFPFAITAAAPIPISYFSNDVGITVENDGDVECGMVIQLYAREMLSNPKIYNYVTQDYFGLTINMQPADLITIDTRQGQKSVTLLRNAIQTNIFNNIMQGSTWLQLEANGSTFTYEVDEIAGDASDLKVTFTHNNLYEGV